MGLSPQPSTRCWVGGAPLQGTAVPPYPIEWCRDGDAFVELPGKEPMSRTLLARVPAGDGTALRMLAIRLRRDQVAPAMAGSHPVALTPEDQEEYWGREMERLRRMGAVEVEEPEPACDIACFGPEGESSAILSAGEGELAGADGGATLEDPAEGVDDRPGPRPAEPVRMLRPLCMPPPVIEPTAFDRNTGLFFPLLCPITRRPLQPCRDQALLARFGLPTETLRYLYEPDQVAQSTGGAAFFYALQKPMDPVPRPERVVLTPEELWARGAEICGALEDDERAALGASPATANWLRVHGGVGPGAEGSSADSASAGGPAGELLNFFPTPAQVLPHVPDDLATASARVGGDGTGLGPTQFRATVRWPVEVLRAKLDLIIQAGELLRRLYVAQDGQPVLVPVAERFAVEWQGPVPEVRLRDGGAPLRYRPDGMAVGRGPMLPVPSPDIPRLLLPSAVSAGEFLQNVQAMLRVAQESMADPDPGDPEDADPPEPGLLVELVADRDPLPKAAAGDVLRLIPQNGGEALWCTVLGGNNRRLRVEHRAADGGGLPAIGAQQPVAATLHRRYHPGCDLRAFGLLAGQVLLANDGLDPLDIQEALLTARGRVDHRKPEFCAANLLHRRVDREAFLESGVDDVVPPALWSELLQQIAEAADSNGRTPPRQPDGAMRPLLGKLRQLRDKFEFELLRREERNRELAGLSLRLAHELRGALMGVAASSSDVTGPGTGGGGR